jgi:hypothetical protein
MTKETDKTKRPRLGYDQTISVRPGNYADGHPLDEVHYVESKIILRGERFTSVKDFHEFGKLVQRAAKETEIPYDTREFEGAKPRIREVIFLDTEDFKLYNNSFILRRRISYEDGFLVGDPEIVFKFRHPELQTAAEMDVRPQISKGYKTKFKAECLPLKDKIGGYRMLYSHNVEFPLSAISEDNRDGKMAGLAKTLPVLAKLDARGCEAIDFVNHMPVEEVLLDLGTLDFGKGIEPVANISVWRTRGDQKQLVGEFAFQAKFQRRDELHDKAVHRCKEFFCELQYRASDWLALGTTKTAAVYRLKGGKPNAHE